MNHFFSVCIPATGRSKTIIRCINSVLNQNFNDFELIVITRNDKFTYDLVIKYLDNNNNGIKYFVENYDSNSINAEDWNDPIYKANGQYISMLEGDDYFEKDHLEIAYNFLSNNEQFDIYISSTNRSVGLNSDIIFSNNEFYNIIYSLKSVPAPSEVIFKRLNKQKKLNIYDVKLFFYAPEIDLYLKILSNKSLVYKSHVSTVFREPSSKPYERIDWIYYRDHIIILFKYFKLKKINYFLRGFYNIILMYCKCLVLFILWKLKLKK
jgi:glycosyltransferase involved in cell wall biosynthesis